MMFTTSNDLLDSMWVEKYRPKSIHDVVLQEEQKQFMLKSLEKGEIPHMALFGPPGSGKTTLARVVVECLIKNEMDVLLMNGSDSTGVDAMRTTVLGFLKSPPYASKMKIIFIDEFDYVTKNAQAILRNMMETYAENGRFLVTGNYWSKIDDPIQSRFTLFEMKTLSKEYVTDYVLKILKSESIEFDQNSVDLVIQNFIPDVRKIVNTLQKNTISKKLKKLDVESLTSVEKKICGLIVQICDDMGTPRRDSTNNQNIPTIMQLISSGPDPDYKQLYESLFYNEKLPLWAKIKVNQYLNYHNSSVLPSAHFMAMTYDIIQAGMTYFQMFAQKK